MTSPQALKGFIKRNDDFNAIAVRDARALVMKQQFGWVPDVPIKHKLLNFESKKRFTLQSIQSPLEKNVNLPL